MWSAINSISWTLPDGGGTHWFVNREFSFSLLLQHANAHSSSDNSRRCDKLTEKGISIVLNISLHAFSKGIKNTCWGRGGCMNFWLIDVKDLVCLNNSRITDVRRSRLLSVHISCSLLIPFKIQICLRRREINRRGRGKRAHWSPRNTGALTWAATYHSQTCPACYVYPDERGGSTVAFTEENRKLWSIIGKIFKNLKDLENVPEAHGRTWQRLSELKNLGFESHTLLLT